MQVVVGSRVRGVVVMIMVFLAAACGTAAPAQPSEGPPRPLRILITNDDG